MVILTFNYVDRVALGMALEDIKAELGLSDTQLGLLTGIAFAFFYSLMGVPIARWADRGNRIVIITLTTTLWSLAVILSGTAASFLQLMLIRVAIGVGEAGCLPPAHSLIADYFTRAERPRAVGIYTMGAPLSVIVGYFSAGWLNEFYGWRIMFMFLGLPGILLAILAWLTLKEPRINNTATAKPETHAESPPGMGEVFSALWRNRTFRYLLLCIAVSNFFMQGMYQWIPAFFVRSYGLGTGEIGTWLSLCIGVCAVLGNYWGGVFASRYCANDERRQLRMVAVLILVNTVLSAVVYLVGHAYSSFIFLGLAAMAATATNGPIFATIQSLVPSQMRATSVAIILLFANLIGLGFGPLAAGALSDVLQTTFGSESLRYGLLALCPGYVLCVWFLLKACTTVHQDLTACSIAERASELR